MWVMKISACFGNTKQLKTRWCKVDAVFILGLGDHLITFNKDQMVSICPHMWVLASCKAIIRTRYLNPKVNHTNGKQKNFIRANYAFNLKVFNQIKIMNGIFSLIV